MRLLESLIKWVMGVFAKPLKDQTPVHSYTTIIILCLMEPPRLRLAIRLIDAAARWEQKRGG